VRLATFLSIIGKKGLNLYDSFVFELPEHRNDIDRIFEKFEEHTREATNILAERYRFMKRV